MKSETSFVQAFGLVLMALGILEMSGFEQTLTIVIGAVLGATRVELD